MEWRPSLTERWRKIADVSTFGAPFRWLHGDASMDEGQTSLGYGLVRRSANDSWRIFDEVPVSPDFMAGRSNSVGLVWKVLLTWENVVCLAAIRARTRSTFQVSKH